MTDEIKPDEFPEMPSTYGASWDMIELITGWKPEALKEGSKNGE